MRFDVLDGVRGHLLFMMMLAHLGAQPGMGYLYDVHHARLLQLLDAEFLVFLSGLLVGILYTVKFKSPDALGRFLRQRVGKIYRYYLVSAVPFLILALLAGAGAGEMLWSVGEVLLVQNGGAYSDILPIYIYCFALLFFLSFFLHRMPQALLLVPSGAIYAVSLFNYEGGVFGLSGKFVVFDIAAWQFLFFIAYLLGLYFKQILGWINGLSVRQYLAAFVLSGALCLSQRWAFVYPPFGELPADAYDNWFRMHLHPVHVVRILTVTAFFTLVAVRSVPATRWVSALLHWYFTLPILRYCGIWAIQMFVIHVYLIAFFTYFQAGWSAQEKMIWAVALQALYMILPFGIHWHKTRGAKSRQALQG